MCPKKKKKTLQNECRLTRDRTLAGVSCGGRSHSIWRSWDLVSAILDYNSVTAHLVWHVRHPVGSIPVVLNVGFLKFTILILKHMKNHIKILQDHLKPPGTVTGDAEVLGWTEQQFKKTLKDTERSFINKKRDGGGRGWISHWISCCSLAFIRRPFISMLACHIGRGACILSSKLPSKWRNQI